MESSYQQQLQDLQLKLEVAQKQCQEYKAKNEKLEHDIEAVKVQNVKLIVTLQNKDQEILYYQQILQSLENGNVINIEQKSEGKTYKYETHLHTKEASACGISHAAEYIKIYKKLGYDGIFVTDHFFGGNTRVSKLLDWHTRVEQFCSGYEAAVAEAQRQNAEDGGNFQVFFGFEQTFEGDDYLIYGLDKNWLFEHPEVESMDHKQLFQAVNNQNGLMIQAHPFRMRHYIKSISIHPHEVHGIEVYNGGNTTEQNDLAFAFATSYDFPMTSGSDIHSILFAQDKLSVCGMEFTTPLTSVKDYIERIKRKEGYILKEIVQEKD